MLQAPVIMRPGVVVLCNARSVYACLRLNMLVGVSPSVLRVLQACPRNNGPPTSAFCTGSEFIITSCPSPHPSLPSLRRQLVLHSPLWLSASRQPYPHSSPSSLSLVSPPRPPISTDTRHIRHRSVSATAHKRFTQL